MSPGAADSLFIGPRHMGSGAGLRFGGKGVRVSRPATWLGGDEGDIAGRDSRLRTLRRVSWRPGWPSRSWLAARCPPGTLTCQDAALPGPSLVRARGRPARTSQGQIAPGSSSGGNLVSLSSHFPWCAPGPPRPARERKRAAGHSAAPYCLHRGPVVFSRSARPRTAAKSPDRCQEGPVCGCASC